MSKYILNADLNSPVHSNFIGNAAVYHGYAGMEDANGRIYTEEQCELEADRAAELGVKIARTMYKQRFAEYNEQTGKWDFNTHNMNCFIKWCERLQKRGIDVAIQAGWNNPGCINGTSWNYHIPDGENLDFKVAIAGYVEWVIQTLKYLVFEKGLTNVKYLIMFTESQNGAGILPKGYNHCYDTWCDAVEAVHNRLVKENMRHLFKMVGPNEGSTISSIMVKSVAERTKDYIDVFSSHNYLGSWAGENSGFALGETNIVLKVAGGRIQQNVLVEPNTDYEMTITIKAFAENDKYVSGNILFGAFEPDNFLQGNYFSAGGEPTTRLNLKSTKMVDATELTTDWLEFSHTFNTGDASEVCIGVFGDIKPDEMGAYLKKVVVTKKGEDKNLLNNPDFADPNLCYLADTPFKTSKWGWLSMSAGLASSNAYYDWHRWVKTALQYVPEGKEFWFDEYNVNGMHMDKHYDTIYATRLAAAMLALMTSGAQTSIMWTLFDQLWPNSHSEGRDCWHDGEHCWGVMPTLFKSKTPHPSFYATGLMFKYMGGSEGTKVYELTGGDPIFGAITVSPEGKIGIAVINTFDGERDFELNLSKTLGGVKLKKRIYNPATIKPDEEAKQLSPIGEIVVDNKLSDTIPSYAVVVYSNID
ncbi:MAG: hypothetical protein E7551_03135 [Ruminococcaceae bacterium]|nr:hypothetical protein [Oscillospiraceae bacterium]